VLCVAVCGDPQADLASLYKTMDCFLLPTRGEGWGRPITEAMSMQLPVIGTPFPSPIPMLPSAPHGP
jgi:glycosyltransferase involved in cell wall biosynthesis